jgi:hypothetical protein
MSTIRVAKRHRFTSVHRDTINDASLSFRARGLLIYLLDKPDDWRVNSEAIERAGREGREAVRASLRELEAAGYLERTRTRDCRTGKWMTEAVIHERPVTGSRRRVPDAGFLGANTKTVTDDCYPLTPSEEVVDNSEPPVWFKARGYGVKP